MTESLVRTLSQFVDENLLAISTFNSSLLITSSSNNNNNNNTQAVPIASNGSGGGDDDWDDEPFGVEKPIADDEFLGVESLQRLDPDTREIYLWKPYFNSKTYQVRDYYFFLITLVKKQKQNKKLFFLFKTNLTT